MSRLHPDLHPELTPDVMNKLFKRKIYTAMSFVETPPELLAKITGIHFKTVVIIRRALLTKFSSTLQTGYKFYVQCINECAIIATGIKGLDQLLGGGLTTGNIYELCGRPISGKTQISMTIAANVCHSLNNESVLYIDTRNDVTGHRLAEIIENSERKIENVGELMQKIKICAIRKWNRLLQFLQTFSWDNSNIRLLIIDSVTALYLSLLRDARNRNFVFLNLLANTLHFIAVEHKVAILVTNLLNVRKFDSERRSFVKSSTPFMGKFWYHIPNTRITVTKLKRSAKRVLTITKSCDYHIGEMAEFKITKAGAE